MRLGILHCLEISFSLAFLCEAKAANPGEEFFAKKAVHPLSIELSGTNFTALNQLNQQGNPRAYVHALLREGEQVYADVGLHLKGNASFRPLGDRPCLTVKFDEFHAGQNFHGLTKIHLNNSLQDPSFLTMVL